MTYPHEPSPEAGAYALGILDPAETAEFELHLMRCWVCLEEVHSLGDVVSLLALLARFHPRYGRRWP